MIHYQQVYFYNYFDRIFRTVITTTSTSYLKSNNIES